MPVDNKGDAQHLIMMGMAGTGEIVAILELPLRRIGRHRFLLLAPTGNAARAVGGQVW